MREFNQFIHPSTPKRIYPQTVLKAIAIVLLVKVDDRTLGYNAVGVNLRLAHVVMPFDVV